MSSERERYLTEKVFSNAIKSCQFGLGMKFIRFETDVANKGMQFASSIIFLTVVLCKSSGDGEGNEQKFKVVIKFLPDNEMVKKEFNLRAQFHNEDVMYSTILSFLDHNDTVKTLFPKFYYGESSDDNGNEPIIVIEDLREENFKLSKFQLHLDYNHLITALTALGRFHALSYIAKQKQPNEFDKIKVKFEEHFLDDKERNVFFVSRLCILKSVKELYSIKKNEILRLVIENISAKDSSFDLFSYFLKPKEPMSVICHGDFCNHNLLFKYDSSQPDIPSAIKLIDLQTARYSSPVIDLAMILTLNVDGELRSRHWEEFITVYYNSVSETVRSANCIPPTFEQLIKEFKDKFFYGYAICSWFLPIAMGEMQSIFTLENYSSLSREEIVEFFDKAGGEKTKQALLSMIKHLCEYNYFGFLKK